MRKKDESEVVVYDAECGGFSYSNIIGDLFVNHKEDRDLWDVMIEDGICEKNTAYEIKSALDEILGENAGVIRFLEFPMRNRKRMWKWYRVTLVVSTDRLRVVVAFTDIDGEHGYKQDTDHMMEFDGLTGLYTNIAFRHRVEDILKENFEDACSGKYALVYFDVCRFKAVNDMFGMAEGDRVLRYIASVMRNHMTGIDICCRSGSDRFIFFTKEQGEKLEQRIDLILDDIEKYQLPFKLLCNVGVYMTATEQLPANAMIDRAILAQSQVKGSFSKRIHYYDEELRNSMLTEQIIVTDMTKALNNEQFIAYLQPQYNHSTGRMSGAEALARWKHPKTGMISPGDFVPIFERNGFITKLDFYIFEQVCRFVKQGLDEGLEMVPISSNFSKNDIFQGDFAESLEKIRKKYDVPVHYLRVEITETAIGGNSDDTNNIISELHNYGYIVEMDDFGSGYSSLNVLKDINFDIIKLDMRFLSQQSETKREKTILKSVVKMAKKLRIPVIAEGVEKKSQADYLEGIGCHYIQGFLYSRPIPQEEFRQLLEEGESSF